MDPLRQIPDFSRTAGVFVHNQSTARDNRAMFVPVGVGPHTPTGLAMAEVVRIAEPAAPAGTPSLPQNIEAEAALLGALMIDNRLVEDVQLKLRPDHFHEPAHGRIFESILKLVERNMIANPVTLRPMFEGDQALKELGGPSYLAQLT